jgi:hypothetical protein
MEHTRTTPAKVVKRFQPVDGDDTNLSIRFK